MKLDEVNEVFTDKVGVVSFSFCCVCVVDVIWSSSFSFWLKCMSVFVCGISFDSSSITVTVDSEDFPQSWPPRGFPLLPRLMTEWTVGFPSGPARFPAGQKS